MAAIPIEHALAETLPLTANERKWGFGDVSAVHTGLAIATWGFLFGGATAQMLGFWDGVLAILLASVIGIAILQAALVLPAVRWGTETFVYHRVAYGVLGALLLAILTAGIMAPFWSAILSSMAAAAYVEMTAGGGTSLPRLDAHVVGLVMLALSFLMVVRGSRSVRIVNLIAAPALVGLCVCLFVALFTRVSPAELAAAQPLAPVGDRVTRIMLAVELNIAGAFSWHGLAANLARFASSQRAAVWGGFTGLVLANALACSVGLASALTLGSGDPVSWMKPLVEPWGGVLLLVVLMLANLSSIVAMIEGNCMTVLQNLGPHVQRLGFAGAPALLLGVAAIITVTATDAFYSQFYLVQSYVQSILVGAIGVMLADRLILRRDHVVIAGLYETAPNGRYRFWGGLNPFPFVAMALAAMVYLSLFDPATQAATPWFRWLGASLPATGVAFAAHVILTRLFVIRAGKGDYPSRPPRMSAVARERQATGRRA